MHNTNTILSIALTLSPSVHIIKLIGRVDFTTVYFCRIYCPNYPLTMDVDPTQLP